jgi:sialidase-1
MIYKFAITFTGMKSIFFFLSSLFFAAQTFAQHVLYKQGDDGYSCYRIPALLSTKQGNLLAFAEARKDDCKDAGNIDLVLKRSADGGKTWSAMQIIWDDSTNTCGNPVPIQDVTTGRIILIACWNAGKEKEDSIRKGGASPGRRVFELHSDDEGKTWSGAREITKDVKLDGWSWYATGPCHGVQLSKGRLVVPVNHVEKASGNNYAHIIYSDDHGASWHIGANAPYEKANETTVAELPGGGLMLNSRSSIRQIKYRHIAVSKDGGNSWEDKGTDSTLIEPICQGALLQIPALSQTPSCLLFCNPASQQYRANLTLRASFDNGQTWPVTHVLYPGHAAYSDIALWNKDTICALYEAGPTKPNESIIFDTLPLKEMTDKR